MPYVDIVKIYLNTDIYNIFFNVVNKIILNISVTFAQGGLYKK